MQLPAFVAFMLHLRREPRWVQAILLVFFILMVLYAMAFWVWATGGWTWRADFTALYIGWLMVMDGNGTRLYDPTLQPAYQSMLLQGEPVEGQWFFRVVYPPHVSVVLAPLAMLPRHGAFLVWALVQMGMVAWLVYALWQITTGWHFRERLLVISGFLAFHPVLLSLLHGALSLWIMLCITQFYCLTKQGKAVLAGVWLTLGTFKPQGVALLGIVVVSTRAWRVLAGAAATGLALFLLASGVLGWQRWLEFLGVVGEAGLSLRPTAMNNLKGMLTIMLGLDQALLASRISLVAFGVAVALVGWLWWGRWQPDAADFELRLALTLGLGIFFSPHSHVQDSVVLALAAVLFYAYLRTYQPAHRQAFSIFALSCPPLFFFGQNWIGERLGMRIPTIATIVLLVWVAATLWQSQKRQVVPAAVAPR